MIAERLSERIQGFRTPSIQRKDRSMFNFSIRSFSFTARARNGRIVWRKACTVTANAVSVIFSDGRRAWYERAHPTGTWRAYMNA